MFPLRSRNEPSGQSSSSRTRKSPVKIDVPDKVDCAALVDEERVVSGDQGGKIRFWRVDDGSEVGVPVDAARGRRVFSIAVSRDGRWIVNGTDDGRVQLWNAETCVKEREIRGHHNEWVRAVDVSADGTRIASGSDDGTACVWSLPTGDRLLGPWEHSNYVVGTKFSPDGRLIATTTWAHASVRVYNQDSCRLFDVAIGAGSSLNHSLAWSSDGKLLFALSVNGAIHCLRPSTGTTLAKWTVHDTPVPGHMSIAVASNNSFIATSAGWSVTLWDTTTRQKIGSLVQFDHRVNSLAMSDNLDLAACGDKAVSIRYLGDILPQSYVLEIRHMKIIQELTEEAQRTAEEKGVLYGEIMQLKGTIAHLRHDLAQSRHAVDEQRVRTESLRSCQIEANDEIAQLKETIEKLRDELVVASSEISQNRERSEKEHEALRSPLEDKNTRLERANQELRCLIHVHEQKHQYEVLYAQGRTFEAVKLLLEIEHAAGEHINSNKFLTDWLTESMSRCSKTLEKNGDETSKAGKWEEAVIAYATALSLPSSTPDAVLAKWASTTLTNNTSPSEALHAGVKFRAPRFAVYRAICNTLKDLGRISETSQQILQNDLRDTDTCDERTQWEREFRERWAETLVNLGDTASSSKKHEEAIRYYSDAMSFGPTNLHEVLLKHANELIEVDPSTHKGYEEKHAALHAMGRYSEAYDAFKDMLSVIEQSRDPNIRKLRRQYTEATPAIRKEVGKAIRQLPTVLIDTDTGRLFNKTQQAAAFEELPIYDELRSSMTTTLDHARIRKEVIEFYRYVMFSHRWQLGEPTFQQVENDSVYGLPSSPTFDKLRNFLKLVVALQFKWGWSDTCCVNQLDRGVQQESIVAMFRWYRRSSMTIVHLLGVLSESQEAGCLWKSIWNTRGWTYQEYVASNVVQFYTEDWKPYLNLEMFNHKESPTVLSEMERATNVTTQQLIVLQPGLDRAREKLYLASGRETTRDEDMAYSLFGIFGISLPVVYGEGNLAIGRLLEHILTRSDEVALLAWTGHSGSQYSYLPASLTVYNEIVPPHVPAPIEASEMDRMVSSLRSSIPNISLVLDLYTRLYDLPSLLLVGGRLKLPGIVFQLGPLSPPSESDPGSDMHVYRATTPLLGDVEIKTTADLSKMRGLRLIHPWIGPLVDQDFSGGEALFDHGTRALRLLARLRRPFGGLLLSLTARQQYRRVAADSLILARVQDGASLSQLLQAVCTVSIQ